MPARIIVITVLAIFILSLFVYCVDVFGLVAKNLQFQDICRSYTHIAEQKGGLSENDKSLLVEKLEDAGFNVLYINIKSIARYGEFFDFEVTAVYLAGAAPNLFEREWKEYEFSFKRQIMSRKIG